VGEAAAGLLTEAADADIVTSAAPQPAAAATATEVLRGRVLVVEDGDTNRKLIDLILRRAGLEVATAENGKLGVEAALAAPFDVILMDMQMPVMDGYTAARTLRERGLRLPIIALTAHAMSGDEQKCRAAGCSGFITKPIRADSLLRSVAAAIQEWQASKEATGEAAQASADAASTEVACTPVRPAQASAEVVQASRLPAQSRRDACTAAASICSDLPIDDPDFREIVEEFIDHLHDKLAAMQEALAAGNLEELAFLAHWLKGAGGSAGFAALTAPAKHLETAVKDKQCEEIENAVNELLGLAARIIRPSEIRSDAWDASYT
jgi:CheY-like chemotaxis protein